MRGSRRWRLPSPSCITLLRARAAENSATETGGPGALPSSQTPAPGSHPPGIGARGRDEYREGGRMASDYGDESGEKMLDNFTRFCEFRGSLS